MDEMTNAVDSAFNGLPERLYIALDGKIVYKGGIGPFGYHPSEVEDWLKKHDY
jgi:type I thyroxine 5'-deiodinase